MSRNAVSIPRNKRIVEGLSGRVGNVRLRRNPSRGGHYAKGSSGAAPMIAGIMIGLFAGAPLGFLIAAIFPTGKPAEAGK